MEKQRKIAEISYLMDSVGRGEILESSHLTSETSVENIQLCPVAGGMGRFCFCTLKKGIRWKIVKKSARGASLGHHSKPGNELHTFHQGRSLVSGACSQPQENERLPDQVSLLPIWCLILHTHSLPLVAGCWPGRQTGKCAGENE